MSKKHWYWAIGILVTIAAYWYYDKYYVFDADRIVKDAFNKILLRDIEPAGLVVQRAQMIAYHNQGMSVKDIITQIETALRNSQEYKNRGLTT